MARVGAIPALCCAMWARHGIHHKRPTSCIMMGMLPKLSWPRYEASLERPHIVFDRGCVGPPVVPVRDATNFMCSTAIKKTLQLHPRQVHWATLLQAVSERITARPTSGVSGPHKFHVSTRHPSCHGGHSLANPIPNSNSIQSNPNSIPHSLGYGVPCVGSAEASGLQACRC